MSKTITWCVMKQIFHNTYVVRTISVLREFNRFKYTEGGYEGRTSNPISVDYSEVKSYKQFLNESKTGPNAAVYGLMKALDVTKESATESVKTWKVFNSLSTITILHNDELLRDAGTHKSTLRENMYALADTHLNLKKKVKTLQHLGLEINSAISLFQLPIAKLTEFAFITECDKNALTNHNNRILYLSDKLNVDVKKVCVAVCKSIYMLTLPIEKLITVTDYLNEIGMTGQYVVNDFIVYRYSISHIKRKILAAKQAGISPLKPWVVRCSCSIIAKAQARFEANQTMLKVSKSLEDFISQHLDCDIDSVESLIRRDPSIASININALSTLLKLYRDYGYTIHDIFRTSRSLHSSPATIQQRYTTLMKISPHKPELFALVTSEKIYNRYLAKISAQT